MTTSPMTVTIRALGEIRTRLGKADRRIVVPAGTSARQAVDSFLRERLPGKSDSDLEFTVVIFLNGRNIDTLSVEDARLRSGDVLLLTTPVGGG